MSVAAQVVVLLVVLLAGCGSPAASQPPSSAQPAHTAGSASLTAGTNAVSLTSGTVGPFLSRGEGSNFLLWSKPSDREPGWWTIAMTRSGSPIGAPKKIATSPPTVDLVHLSSVSGSQALALTTGADEAGPGLWSLTFGDSGELRGGPYRIADLPNNAVWVDSAPIEDGYLAFWAERGAPLAQVMAVVLDSAGQPRSEITRLHGNVSSWQMRPVPTGAVLAVIGKAQQVEVLHVGPDADVKSRREVPGTANAGSDLDLAQVGSRLILAFSQARPVQPHLLRVTLSLTGEPEDEPSFLVPPKGEQKLIRLLGGDPGYVVWKEPNISDALLAAALTPKASVESAPLRISTAGTPPTPPEFVTTPSGLSLLFWSCPVRVACQEPQLPTLLQIDPSGQLLKLSAWQEVGGRTPDLAWDLRCDGEDCRALGAAFSDPAKVAMKGHNSGQWVIPTSDEPAGPNLSQALIETELLAGVEVMAGRAGHLVTWLTYFDPSTPYVRPKTPAPDGRLAPVRAILASQWLPKGKDGLPSTSEKPIVLSYRARSLAGISLTPRQDRALLAWTAIDGKEPQVFTTVLDSRGQRVRQRMLTRQQGEPTSLHSAALSDGWVVSWCNTRSARTEAYLAKIGPDLKRISQDTSLGEASDLRVAAAWSKIWAIRAAAGRGIFLHSLDANTLKPSGEELSIDSKADAALPRLVQDGKHLLAAWVSKRQLYWLRIDQNGRPIEEASSFELQQAPSDLRLDCSDQGCVAALVSHRENQQFLTHLSLGSRPKLTIVSNHGSPDLPAVLDGEVWFQAALRGGHFAIHRALVPR